MVKKNYISKSTRHSGDGSIRVTMPYSYGKAVPRGGSLQACLCKDALTYSRKCCEGYLINQGIGSITGYFPQPVLIKASPWSTGFSQAFGPLEQIIYK
jgi:hypothetical protein